MGIRGRTPDAMSAIAQIVVAMENCLQTTKREIPICSDERIGKFERFNLPVADS
jgi:hypothetical protein